MLSCPHRPRVVLELVIEHQAFDPYLAAKQQRKVALGRQLGRASNPVRWFLVSEVTSR